MRSSLAVRSFRWSFCTSKRQVFMIGKTTITEPSVCMSSRHRNHGAPCEVARDNMFITDIKFPCLIIIGLEHIISNIRYRFSHEIYPSNLRYFHICRYPIFSNLGFYPVLISDIWEKNAGICKPISDKKNQYAISGPSHAWTLKILLFGHLLCESSCWYVTSLLDSWVEMCS